MARTGLWIGAGLVSVTIHGLAIWIFPQSFDQPAMVQDPPAQQEFTVSLRSVGSSTVKSRASGGERMARAHPTASRVDATRPSGIAMQGASLVTTPVSALTPTGRSVKATVARRGPQQAFSMTGLRIAYAAFVDRSSLGARTHSPIRTKPSHSPLKSLTDKKPDAPGLAASRSTGQSRGPRSGFDAQRVKAAQVTKPHLAAQNPAGLRLAAGRAVPNRVAATAAIASRSTYRSLADIARNRGQTAWEFSGQLITDPASLATIDAFYAPDSSSNAGSVRRYMEQVLSGTYCGRLNAHMSSDTGAITLRGHVPFAELIEPLRQAIQGQIGTALELKTYLIVLGEPLCQFVEDLATIAPLKAHDTAAIGVPAQQNVAALPMGFGSALLFNGSEDGILIPLDPNRPVSGQIPTPGNPSLAVFLAGRDGLTDKIKPRSLLTLLANTPDMLDGWAYAIIP